MVDREDPSPPQATRTEGEGETRDLPGGMRLFAPGQVLGGRYQIREVLGRGGMGEVWRAFDLKLRVEVALKALRKDLFKDEHRLEVLRSEVRSAREVLSPNVCRIFDLIEADGTELVSMEFVDGQTLLQVLNGRSPLELQEAQDIASQFLAGLEAIHRAGLVHRDVKPENIMITRAGRVVLMDFGLARQEDSGSGTVSGTPAYMAPEQAAGKKVDARTDVYSAGVVLAEMVSPEGIKSPDSRQSLWEGVRSDPPQLPDSPWAPVLAKAVARQPGQRHDSAHTLTRALEEVTLRVEGAEDLTPYPGLAAFTEEDAEYFFGREVEVEQMWRKLERPHVLALIGPSGAGKSSFLRAGLIPSAPADWVIVHCTPGNTPVLSLGRALGPEMAGDAQAVDLLLRFDDPDVAVEAFSSWRQRHGQALLIVDQFEELFTQNAPEVQARFAELLGRLALEGDVHVLLSMRDDFFFNCHQFPALAPLLDGLTMLGPPIGPALRRALVQPATNCGYGFEDDRLVEEMLAEVEGERGALPLLAFAMARLWEKRDRENGLITRVAYHDIGGVGGALARHAEATLDRIGVERLPIVRELFRNLVTAEGTRAVRAGDELLSVFGTSQREQAETVLGGLIDARLLTSYEVHGEEERPTRRVEIIHESLLANWPRLVRWQTQDADAAQLRDQLRQAARTWDEHDRSDDLLWTGTAFREYQVWRERYPGGLTDIEEAFGDAMATFAGRRRRRRRLIVGAVMAALVAGLAVVGSFWQRSIREARRAEAANLVSLGQLELDSYPSAAVAHAIASLELSDGSAARRLALEALWKGPTALVASEDRAFNAFFSPDGRFLVKDSYILSDNNDAPLTIFNAAGSSISPKNVHGSAPSLGLSRVSASGHFASYRRNADSSVNIAIWSVVDDQPVAETTLEASRDAWEFVVDSSRQRAVLLIRDDDRISVDALRFDGTHQHLGTPEIETRRDEAREWTTVAALDPRAGAWLGVVTGSEVYVVDVGDHELGPPRLLGRHDGVLQNLDCDPEGRFIATAGEEGEIRFWSLTKTAPPMVVQGPPNSPFFRFTAVGSLFEAAVQEDDNYISWVWDMSGATPRFLRKFSLGGTSWAWWTWDTAGRNVARTGPDTSFRWWPMNAPPDADPVSLLRGDNVQPNALDFNPQGGWLATTDLTGLVVWPLAKEYPIVIRRHKELVVGLAFAPDGSWIASSSNDGTVRTWPLVGDPPAPGSVLFESDTAMLGIAASPDGQQILAGSNGDGTRILSLDGSPARNLEGFSGQTQTWGVAFSHDGRWAAAAGGRFNPAERQIRVWESATGNEVATLEINEAPMVDNLSFDTDGRLYSVSESGLLRWNIETGERTVLYDGLIIFFAATADGRRVLMVEAEEFSKGRMRAVLLETESGVVTQLDEFGDDVTAVALDPAGTIAVTGDLDGEVRVGSLAGGETHLLVGHESRVYALAIDPVGRWIASGGSDATIRLWPMPDLSKPPLHTLPREELIAKLKTLTNLRVVRDEESATGWKLTHDPFPGWETVPTW